MRLSEPMSSPGAGQPAAKFPLMSPGGNPPESLLPSPRPRLNIDFDSLFSGNARADQSLAVASPIAPPKPAHEPTRQSDPDRDAIVESPNDDIEIEDESVEENDSVTLQPLGLAVETPVAVAADTTPASATVLASDQHTDNDDSSADADRSHEQATNDRVTKTTAASATSGAADAESTGRSNRAWGETTTLPAVPTDAPPSGDLRNTGDADADFALTGDFGPLAKADSNGTASAALATSAAAGDGAELTPALTQPNIHNRLDPQQPTSGDDPPGRSSRNGRGRAAATGQKGRATPADSTGRGNQPGGDRNAADPLGASEQKAAIAETGGAGGDDEIATASIDPAAIGHLPAGETGAGADGGTPLAAGPAHTNPTADPGRASTPGVGSPDLAIAGSPAGDDSGSGRDFGASRNAENLSRTDIADRARMIHRISKAFTKMSVDGGQIRMKMHPEELGSVLLEMRVRGRTVEATVTADNESARSLLQQQLSELRQRLESQGMTVQRLEVALRDDSAGEGSWFNQPDGQRFGDQQPSGGFSQGRRPAEAEAAKRSGLGAVDSARGTADPAALDGRQIPSGRQGGLDLRL